MSETFKQFCDGPEGVIAATFPQGQPEELVFTHRLDIKAALIDVCSCVEYYKRRCKDFFPYCSTLFSCGATVVEAPRGEIQRIYTLEGNCCPVFYDWVQDYDVFLNWLNASRKKWNDPANIGMPPLSRGFRYSESSLDKSYRNNWGKYTINGPRLYLGERIESTESVVVEYLGIKRNWKDDDLMPFDDAEQGDKKDMGVELKLAVASYLRAAHLRKWERDERGFALEKAVYDQMIAELKTEEWRQKIPKQQGERKYEQHSVSGESTCRDAECAAVESETDTAEGVFAILGDYGLVGDGQTAVADLIKSWEPEFIVTTGDNWYGSEVDLGDLEDVQAVYADFIPDNFYVTIGNHDRDPDGRLAIELAYFKPPPLNTASGPQTKPYYSVRRGHVEFFPYDSGYDSSQVNQQPDGVGLASIEAGWLRTALANSTAKFKVVLVHQPPYTSFRTTIGPDDAGGDALSGDGFLAYPALRLPFKDWGADVVFSGHIHSYERLEVDGFPYIVNGAGGREVKVFSGAASPYSILRYDGDFGAIKAVATCDLLTLSFVSLDGTVRDTLEIDKS